MSATYEIQEWEQMDVAALAARINRLITDDFSGLINLLYRLDISEAKLKKLLSEHPQEDAGKIIAELIVERQQQKLQARQQFHREDNIPEDEKW
ncbi:hypothetical protein SAMN05444410_1179 [Hydrobacter penzbergensis]|jgi:hypothetical protein|uniref:Uncharacterized protein n=1 Tax=Hydrobacter penzbergensis TaxID=1235997 RepID=A0A8X8IF31_9BACT|nr:hypothetical protein [Hydrobacter penzbergensis]SDX47523.1 hypothetical protein SAMN05444410_1179 [Hydrobacter penzbergensis]